MRKNLVKGMAALCMCAAFASCSHDTDFEASNQEFTVENLKNEYKAAFEQKYGKIGIGYIEVHHIVPTGFWCHKTAG